MRLCNRALDRLQIINENGDVRICGWLKDGGIIGNLLDDDLDVIYRSKEAERIRQLHANDDYSNCDIDSCPYLANENWDFAEIDEVGKYPKELHLAYENICNYHCVMCTIPECAKRLKAADVEEKLNRIDDKVRKVLPYIKTIGANGLGELFASKHIMQILSEWKPLARPEECSVFLETNGSLFNEKNWEKISNLGQYYLSVSITVLSFDEKMYQYLSGTTLPITNLISNLSFVKRLREEGVVNHFQIVTVYQEKNFRELPDFARRCIEEFNADYVRLRPFEPWGEDTMAEWFKDVRNKHHPYHEDFLEVMKDSIFKHPKVLDGGGGRESVSSREPYLPLRHRSRLMEIVMEEDFSQKVKDVLGNRIAVYGMGVLGKALVRVLYSLGIVKYCIDSKNNGYSYAGIPVVGIDSKSSVVDKGVNILISNIWVESMIVSALRDNDYTGDIITISELTNIKRSDFM